MSAAWNRTEFEAQLRERGRSYHIHHPFNVMLNTGKATPEQIRGWVANRFYYQIAIPIKDAAVLSNCPDREVRRGWIQRILDHDGFEIGAVKDPGGIEAWLPIHQQVQTIGAEDSKAAANALGVPLVSSRIVRAALRGVNADEGGGAPFLLKVVATGPAATPVIDRPPHEPTRPRPRGHFCWLRRRRPHWCLYGV